MPAAWIHHTILGFALGLAPLFWLGALLYRRSYRNVEMVWKKPQLVLFTILTFVLNLTCFVLACFFLASYLGQLQGVGLMRFAADTMWTLAIDCLLLMTGITLFYMGLQNLFTQFVLKEGVVLHRFNWKRLRLHRSLLGWDKILDYYIHSDYPVTYFNFLYRTRSGYKRRTLRVPFYALPRFESLLEHHMEHCQLERQAQRARMRDPSER